MLHDWEKESFAEIASRLGVTEETARKRHERAVVRLSERVGQLRRREIGELLEGTP